ncbi:MAG: type III toxin-antitoxin system ToxN/AbiQ family toxin [Cetobacterium sp.]
MKIQHLKLYVVDSKFLKYLKEHENKIMDNFDLKNKRPYLGIVLTINNFDYLVPLTSPKLKHLKMKNQMDFLKIDNGLYGAINFNNMFPVISDVFFEKNINLEEDPSYKELLKNQLQWCNELNNKASILKKAEKVYLEISLKKEKSFLWSRCCNFTLLEELSKEYK